MSLAVLPKSTAEFRAGGVIHSTTGYMCGSLEERSDQTPLHFCRRKRIRSLNLPSVPVARLALREIDGSLDGLPPIISLKLIDLFLKP